MSLAELGCLKSHLNVLLQAKKQGYDRLLVLEDDIELCDDFDNRLTYYLKQLPPNWGALWLGGRAVGHVLNSGKLTHLKHTTGTYGYIVANHAFDAFIAELKRGGTLADWCMSRAFDKVSVYRTCENLVKHLNGFSIIQNKVVKYHDLSR